MALSCIVTAQIMPVYAMQYETPPNLELSKTLQDKNCKAGLYLAIKLPENRALCLKAGTILKLTSRGWQFSEIKNQQSSSYISGQATNNQYLKLPQDLLGPIPHRLVFFMASGSSAKIYVQYTSGEPNTGNMKSWATVYVGKANYTPLNSTKLMITADPPSIPLAQGSNTTVVYTITAKKDASGIYWITLAQICGVMPVVIDMESSHLAPSDIPVPIGSMHCPAQLLDAKILGIYGGIAEYKIAQPIDPIKGGGAIQGEKNYHIYFPGKPPPVEDTRIAKIVSGPQEAQSLVGYRVDTPHYLLNGYSTQAILVDNYTKFVKILVSNFPITQNTTSVEFMDNGGILIYMEPLTPAFNQTSWTALWLNQTLGSSTIKIGGYDGVINDIMKGKRFDEEIDIPAELVIFRNDAMVQISGFVHSGELIKIAESMLKS